MHVDTGTICEPPSPVPSPCSLLINPSYGGKLQRIERQIHHYGSALNSQPLLSSFRTTPTDTHLLRTGYAGTSAPL